MKSKKIFILLISILILIILAAAAVYSLSNYIYEKPSVRNNVRVEIKKGEGLKTIALKLKDTGVLDNENIFILYIMYEGLQDNLKAGEYEFQKGSTIARVAEQIANGEVVSYSVTIPEGLTSSEIAELLDEKNVVDKDEFLELLSDDALQEKLLGNSSYGFEGFLFPDTYEYNSKVTPIELIKRMVSRFNEIYTDFDEERSQSSLNDFEIIILASIIEKETGSPDERSLVSAVFHNRLQKGMKLDSDPTVIYGLGDDYRGKLYRSDLKRETAYNTYIIKGLPPGPIANPGKESILAALNPEDVNYLYFVSKGDGSGRHNFSSNYEDHKKAVYQYRKTQKP